MATNELRQPIGILPRADNSWELYKPPGLCGRSRCRSLVLRSLASPRFQELSARFFGSAQSRAARATPAGTRRNGQRLRGGSENRIWLGIVRRTFKRSRSCIHDRHKTLGSDRSRQQRRGTLVSPGRLPIRRADTGLSGGGDGLTNWNRRGELRCGRHSGTRSGDNRAWQAVEFFHRDVLSRNTGVAVLCVLTVRIRNRRNRFRHRHGFNARPGSSGSSRRNRRDRIIGRSCRNDVGSRGVVRCRCIVRCWGRMGHPAAARTGSWCPVGKATIHHPDTTAQVAATTIIASCTY